jgi:hypothetical protein
MFAFVHGAHKTSASVSLCSIRKIKMACLLVVVFLTKLSPMAQQLEASLYQNARSLPCCSLLLHEHVDTEATDCSGGLTKSKKPSHPLQ